MPEPRPIGTYSASSGGAARNSSSEYVATPFTRSGAKDGANSSRSATASRAASSRAISKSSPCSIRRAPNARIAAFFSTLLPCGTTTVTAMP